jgi:outer membrane scaffolding protein for murein synthesis (MipA/OmpV family)
MFNIATTCIVRYGWCRGWGKKSVICRVKTVSNRFGGRIARSMIGGVLCTLGLGQVAHGADAPPPPAQSTASSDWIVTLGASGRYGPRFDGARSYTVYGMPSVSFRRANEPAIFTAPDDNFDYAVFGSPWFRVGPVASLRGERSEKSDARLLGLDKVPWTVEAGVFGEVWPIENTLRIRVEILHGLRENAGTVANFSADLVKKVGPYTVSGGPRVSVADDDFMQFHFGVTPAAAMRNGFVQPFDAKAGFKSAGYNLSVSYQWSPAWKSTIWQNYDRLVDDAGRSPITSRLGSPNQFSLGLATYYSFGLPLK